MTPTDPVSVLAVGRNGAALTRFQDVLQIFSNDPRVRVRYTAAPGSPHADGTSTYLAALGAKTIAWANATGAPHRLAVATSANAALHELRAPVLLLPHGAGRHKLAGTHPYGLSPRQLLHGGRVVPAAIGLSDTDQFEILSRSCPPALERAVLVGDPCYDRLAAAAHLTPMLRRALRLAGRELVVISSTWGPGSLFAAAPDLPEQLLAALPADQYALALVLHPNIWSDYGRDQIVGRWLERAVRAGLMVVPWEQGWQAAALAAHYVVGDHGSVTYYAAALGKPVLLAAFDEVGLVPGTGLTRLAQRAVRLDPRGDVPAQLAAAAREADKPLIEPGFAPAGRSLEALRDLAYGLMDLAPPATVPDPPAVTEPDLHAPQPTCYRVRVHATAADAADGSSARVERYSALVPGSLAPDDDRPLHIAADLEHPQLRHLHRAAVLYTRSERSKQAAAMPIKPDEVFRDYPGARVAAHVEGEACTVMLAEGAQARAHVSGADPAIAASLVYARLSAVLPGAAFDPVVLELGSRRVTVVFTPVP